MKIFFYKSLLVFFLFLLAFHFSINYVVKITKQEIENTISKEKIKFFESKIKEEINNALKKEVIIKKEDAILINKFLDKVIFDLKNKRDYTLSIKSIYSRVKFQCGK